MKNILLSAFRCNPSKGSEFLNGWNWAIGLAKEGFNVHVLTQINHEEDINKHAKIQNLTFHYIKPPFNSEKLYSYSLYLYYILWQWKAYKKGKQLHKLYDFHRIQHVSWGSIQQGSFLYKLRVPLIFGPAGGAQKAPEDFKSYFLNHWNTEVKRNIVSKLFFYLNPACKTMLKKSFVVLVSNQDTKIFAKKGGAKNVELTLDAALPDSFFPDAFILRSPTTKTCKILWVGRFLPRKGLLMILDIMDKLKEYNGIKLTIVGDGEMREEAEKKMNELQLNNSVNFVGKVPFSEVQSYYQSHDLFLFTSLRDSCPAQLIEAMAYNLPVITLDLHGQGQIVSDKTGIKIPLTGPENTVKEVAKAIINILNNPVLYKKISESAFTFSRNQVWHKKIAEHVKKHY